MFNKSSSKDQEMIKLLSEKLAAEARANAATEEISRLRGQVDRLQDALVATTAPRAYEDRRADTEVPVDTDHAKKFRKEAELNAELLYRMEQPTFKDADDMIAMLTGDADFMKSVSVHGNSES